MAKTNNTMYTTRNATGGKQTATTTMPTMANEMKMSMESLLDTPSPPVLRKKLKPLSSPYAYNT